MKNNNAKGRLAVITAIVVVTLIFVNVAVGLIPYGAMNVDTTEAGLYTVSDSTKNFFSSVDTDVTIYVVDADGSDVKYEYFLRELESTCDHVKLKWVTSESVSALIDEMGLKDYVSPYLLILETEYRKSAVSYGDLTVYVTNDSQLVQTLVKMASSVEGLSTYASYFQNGYIPAALYPYLNTMFIQMYSSATDASTANSYYQMCDALWKAVPYFAGESYICRQVENVTIKNIPTGYVLKGHGETDFLKTSMGIYLQQYAALSGLRAYAELDTTVSISLPEDAVSIVMLNPQKDITENELFLLTQYVADGGELIVITDAKATTLTNLMTLMSRFGLSSNGEILGEFVEIKASAEEKEAANEAGETIETVIEKHEGVVNAVLNYKYGNFESLESSDIKPVIKGANEIMLKNPGNTALELKPLLYTSEKSFAGDNTETLAERTIAAAAENVNSGGRLCWFTGADSYCGVITEENQSTDEGKALHNNRRSMLYVFDWSVYA